jgi:thiosulfate/3-mercaptopyruvate sulfurtransferase
MLFSQILFRALLGGLAALSIVPGGAGAQEGCGEREPPPGPLVSADWLRRHRSDSNLVVLSPGSNRAVFDSAHIADARFVPVERFTVRRGELLTELPPLEQLDSLFEVLGVGDRGRIVLYGETLPVTRLFFTLDYLGLGERVSVLDGGLPAWRAAGGPVTAAPTPVPGRTILSLTPDPGLLADAEWIDARRSDPRVVLLDTRSREEFEGTRTEEGVARPGRIPGAVNLNWTATIADGKFREPGALRQLLAAVGATPGKELVTYCRVGTRASVLYFVGRLLGYQVRLYDGSMNEWAGKPGLSVATGPPPRP